MSAIKIDDGNLIDACVSLKLTNLIKMFLVCFPSEDKDTRIRLSTKYLFYRLTDAVASRLQNKGNLPELSLGDIRARRFSPHSTNSQHVCNIVLDLVQGHIHLCPAFLRDMIFEHPAQVSLNHFFLNERLMTCVVVWEGNVYPQVLNNTYFKRFTALAEGVFENKAEHGPFVSIECSSQVHQEMFEDFFGKVRVATPVKNTKHSIVDLIVTDLPDEEMFARAKRVACYASNIAEHWLIPGGVLEKGYVRMDERDYHGILINTCAKLTALNCEPPGSAS